MRGLRSRIIDRDGVKNGINMTGMPSFALAGATDEELWSIVAFVKKQPDISESDYKAWTQLPAAVKPSPLSNQPSPEPSAPPAPSK